MAMRLSCWLLLLVPLVIPARSAAQVDEIVEGYVAGGAAGKKVSVLMPAVISASAITALTLADQEPATNNRVVRVAITNAAIGAGVSWVVTRLFRPQPQPARYSELLQASDAYQEGFRRGFFESMGSRQTVSNMMGVIVGSLVSGAIYKARQ